MFLLLVTIEGILTMPQYLVSGWLARRQPSPHHNWLAGQSRGVGMVELSVGLVGVDEGDELGDVYVHKWGWKQDS